MICFNRLITTTRPGTVSGVSSARFDAPPVNRQRVLRYQTVTNRDGKIHPKLLEFSDQQELIYKIFLTENARGFSDIQFL